MHYTRLMFNSVNTNALSNVLKTTMLTINVYE